MITKFYKGNRYYYAWKGKQVTFVRYDQVGLAVVVDDDGEQYHIHVDDLSELSAQSQMTIDEALKREG